MLSKRILKTWSGLTVLLIALVMLTGCTEQQLAIGSQQLAAASISDASSVLAKTNAENEVEIEGVVQALSATSITINNQSFNFDPAVVVLNGNTLRVGGRAELKAKQVNGVLTVVSIVPEERVEQTTTITTTQTVKPVTPKPTTVKPTSQPTDDKGKGDTTPKAGSGKGNEHSTATVTPKVTQTVHTTPDDKGGKGDTNTSTPQPGDDKGGNHATPTPSVTLTVKPTETEHPVEPTHDKGNEHSTPTPTSKSDDGGNKGGEHKTPTPTANPTTDDKGGDHNTATPTAKPTTDDKGGHNGGDDNGGKGGKNVPPPTPKK